MAINVDTVYQKVLVLANKEQRGYITPQEFNLLADKAQNEIYENYFHQARNSNAKLKDDDQHTDTLEMIEAKLSPFYKSHNNITVASGVLNLLNPVGGTNTGADIYKLVSVNQVVGSNLRLVTEVNRSEYNLITNHSESVLYPISSRPIYYRQTETNLNIIPAPSDGTIIVISYYKLPVAPKWAYVVVNEKALYNINNSVDFELHASEEETLVLRILMLAGLTIQKPDIVQAGGQGLQMINQEQNS
tara:strand:- start:811 stop:1548 length:738 start_codon:yes stop_codon:yes gene_type:complete